MCTEGPGGVRLGVAWWPAETGAAEGGPNPKPRAGGKAGHAGEIRQLSCPEPQVAPGLRLRVGVMTLSAFQVSKAD
jgi:hypothetical protein